jgi:acetyl-CoA carboxylase carboxyl transferase subunit beta
MTWFKREDNEIEPTPGHEVRTEGLWIKCPQCNKPLFKGELETNLQVCRTADGTSSSVRGSGLRACWSRGMSWSTWSCVSTDPLEFTDLKPYKAAAGGRRRRRPG